MAISTLLFLTSWELATNAITRLRDPSLIQTEVTPLSFGALLVSIAIHLIVVWYELGAGRKLQSDVLVADALHTRADIFVSLSVIAGLIVVQLGFPLADPIIALIIALVIAKAGIDIIRESSPALMDQATLPSDEVAGIALSVHGVVSVHQIRSRGHETAVYADLHIRVDPGTPTEEAHAIAHEVQTRLRERQPDIQDVTIHVEPAGPDVETKPQEAIALRIRRVATGLGLSVHDIWMHTVDDKHYVEVHLEADGSMPLREAHDLASALEERMLADFNGLAELTTHLEPRGKSVAEQARLRMNADTADAMDHISDTVCQIVDTITPGETCHGIRVYRHGDGWGVSFHCRLPGELSLADAHERCSQIEGQLRGRIPELDRVIIHAEPRRS